MLRVLTCTLAALATVPTSATPLQPTSKLSSSRPDPSQYPLPETHELRTLKLYHLTTKFLDSFVYPHNNKQAALINSTFFAPDVLGRVDATRTFDGPELNTEYVYGLFAGIPGSSNASTDAASSFFTLLGRPLSYEITHFAADQNIVSVTSITTFAFPFINTNLPLEVNTWLTFNPDGRISQYDATFRYLAWEFAHAFSIGQKLLHADAPTLQSAITQKLATSICDIETKSCKGANKQYASKAECVDTLTKQVRFGQPYEMGMNTLLCRMVHQGMVPLRPDVHCSHIGPSGGAYCNDDRGYEQTVRQKYFTNAPFVLHGLH